MPRRMLGILFGSAVVAVAACALVITASYRSFGLWLAVNDPVPRHLDVLMTFSGDRTRVTYSGQLRRSNPETFWVLSWPGRSIFKALHRRGVDTTGIVFVDTCSSTFAEMRFLLSVLDSLQSASSPDDSTPLAVGLVSSPYHMRRIMLLASRLNREPSRTFHALGVPYELEQRSEDQYRHWWEYPGLKYLVEMEALKIVHELVRAW